MDLFALDQAALSWCNDVIAQLDPDQLDDATPCGDWRLRDLIAHMIAHNHGFAAAAFDSPVGADVWDSVTFDGDLVAGFGESAAVVTAAFSEKMPEKIEVFGFGAVPSAVAMSMHIVDYTVHGWDVAAALGLHRLPPEDLSEAALRIMKRFPVDRPSKSFGEMVPIADDAPVGERLMAYVGRNPRWPAEPGNPALS